MSENMDASNKGEVDDQGPPIPDDSTSSSSESSATGQEALNAILGRLDSIEEKVSDERLSDLVDARVKSDKDKRWDKAEEEISDLRSIIEKAGGDYELVEKDITIGELTRRLDALEGHTGGGTPPVSSDWQVAQGKIDAQLQGAKISQEDPGYKALVSRYKNKVSPEEFVEIVSSFVETRQRSASPATVLPDVVGTPPDNDTTNALLNQYNERLAKIPQGDARALHNLKKEYREKGLPIY